MYDTISRWFIVFIIRIRKRIADCEVFHLVRCVGDCLQSKSMLYTPANGVPFAGVTIRRHGNYLSCRWTTSFVNNTLRWRCLAGERRKSQKTKNILCDLRKKKTARLALCDCQWTCLRRERIEKKKKHINDIARRSEQTFRSRDESQPLAVFSCSQEYSTPTHKESRLQTVWCTRPAWVVLTGEGGVERWRRRQPVSPYSCTRTQCARIPVMGGDHQRVHTRYRDIQWTGCCLRGVQT